MRFTPLREEVVESNTVFIKSIGDNGFRLLNGTYLVGPIAAFPTIALSWRVRFCLCSENIDENCR